MLAAVNLDITTRESLKAVPVDAGKIPMLKSVCGIVHTPDVVAKYQAAQKPEKK